MIEKPPSEDSVDGPEASPSDASRHPAVAAAALAGQRIKRGPRLRRELIQGLPKLSRRPWTLDSQARLEADMRPVVELDPDTFLSRLEALVPASE